MLLRDAIRTDVASTLADYTGPALMVPRLKERDTAGVVKELSELLHAHGRLPDMLQFYHAVMNREFLVNTAMDFGIAFPHARLNGLAQPQFALGRGPELLAWGKSAPAVELVFLLAVPATDAAGYLHILAAVGKLGHSTALMQQIRAAQTPAEMFGVLQQIRLRQR